MTRLERRAWSAEGQALRAVSCNLCGSGERRALAVENGLEVVRCRGCGLVYVTPQPTAKDLERFYEGYYAEDGESDWRRIMERIFRRDAARLRALLGRPGRLLDVGAGFGHFALAMREAGWKVAAVESSSVAAARLAAQGVPVHRGQVPDVEAPAERFDVVTASSVLEHVADPRAVLAWMFETLRPGGWVLVRVPNVRLLSLFFPLRRFEGSPFARAVLRALRREIMDEENLFHVIDPPGHLYGFDSRTLRAALESGGFEQVVIGGDPMPVRGNAFNAVIDGAVFRIAEALRLASAGRLILTPNVVAWGRRPVADGGSPARVW
jgi:2-polyprenyl-3-methyl-5-hydroxy-6-metoxy-1,4-benzoquinol methylase